MLASLWWPVSVEEDERIWIKMLCLQRETYCLLFWALVWGFVDETVVLESEFLLVQVFCSEMKLIQTILANLTTGNTLPQ